MNESERGKLIIESTKSLLQELSLSETVVGVTVGVEKDNDDLALSLFGAVPDHKRTVLDLSKFLQHMLQADDNNSGDYVIKFQLEFLICSHEVMQFCAEASKFGGMAAGSNDSSKVRAHAETFQLAIRKYNEARDMIQSVNRNIQNMENTIKQQLSVVRKILNLLSLKIRRCRVEFIAWGNKVLASALHVNDRCIDIIETGSSLDDTYHVLKLLNAPIDENNNEQFGDSPLERFIHTFTKDVFQNSIEPILNSAKANIQLQNDADESLSSAQRVKPCSFKHSSSKTSGKKIHHRLEWEQKDLSVVSNDTTISLAIYEDVLNNIISVLSFICEHAFLNRSDLLSIVTSKLFIAKDKKGNGVLTQELLTLQHSIIPSTLSDLPVVFKSLPIFVSDFEKSLCSFNLLPSPGLLSKSISDLELKYAEKRRMDILSEGHSILMKDYHNTVQVGDKPARISITDEIFDMSRENPFIFSICSVSSVAQEVLLLARRTLNEATENDQEQANEIGVQTPRLLYRTSRELFDLFRAVIFSRHGHAIETIPRCAAVIHNDCSYIAYNLLTLGLEYRSKFRTDIQKLCTFVDMVPIFRQQAEEKLGEMIKRQKDQLVEIMETKMSDFWHSLALDDSSGNMTWCEAETAVNGAMYHIKQLEQAWEPILAADIYCKAMGNLYDTVFDVLLHHVMRAPDISEAACPFVHSLFGSVLFSAEQSFPKGESVAKTNSKGWKKFYAVGKFMNFSLSDINQCLVDGFFKDLTGQEMSCLIKSTFADSEKREKLLLALADSD